MAATQSLTFNTPGTYTWVCPGGVTRLRLRGWGGGGSGGGGCGSPVDGTTSKWPCGGAGGGGSQMYEVEVTVVPGTTYEIVIPAASAGGAGGAQSGTATPNSGVDGIDGGDVLFKVQGGATLATFAGGMRGGRGTWAAGGATSWIFAIGGAQSVAKPPSPVFTNLTVESIGYFPIGNGHGGIGMTSNGDTTSLNRRGCESPQGYAGGVGGETIWEVAPGIFTGPNSQGTWGNGGAGGGGGAGPGGPGGAGGNADDTLNIDGYPGGAGAAGSGAGGGGGGAGCMLPAPNNGGGGAGGAGGCGACTLTWTV